MNSECLHLCNPSPSDSPDWFGDQQPLDAMNGYYLVYWTTITTTTTKHDGENWPILLSWFVCLSCIHLSCNEYNWALPKDKKVNQNIAALISVNFVFKTKTNCWRDSLV